VAGLVNELLAAYDADVRATFAQRLPPGWTPFQDGPLTRCLTTRGGFAMAATSLAELSDAELAGLVERTVAFYAGHGRRFEWKTYDHDRPDLGEVLGAHGLVPDDHEALVIGDAAGLAVDAPVPEGLTLRTVAERADFVRVATMESEVWGEDWSWLADDLVDRCADPYEPTRVYVVEDGDRVVSAAWLAPVIGTRFAGLWGGSTLAEHRGRGLYRALVARRARDAVAAGYSLLQVDASDDSRPILERLGLQVVGGTTPYVWTPDQPSSPAR
jgi:hypothetical protein